MYDKYLIKEGETLEDIASRFNTSVDMILNINDIYSREYLRAGEEIIVPKNQESYFTYYTVNQGDSLYQIARKYNINPSLLALLNGLNMEDYIYRVIVYINWVIVYINMSETPYLLKKSQLKIVYVYINSVFVYINYSYCIFDVN